MNNEIISALKEVITALNRHNVQYMVIGGTAVGYYGYQRISGTGYATELTPDLDFWYNPTLTNFYNLVNAIKELGVDTKSLDNLVFDPKKTFLRIQKEHYRLEFLCDLKGLDYFDKCFTRAKDANLNNVSFKVIGYADLLINKEATKGIVSCTPSLPGFSRIIWTGNLLRAAMQDFTTKPHRAFTEIHKVSCTTSLHGSDRSTRIGIRVIL